MIISGYVGMGDLFGVPSPAMLVPPLSDLLPELSPAGQVSWVDDAGWHAQGVTPFPGAALIGSDPTMSIAAPALVSSILLPSLNRARDTSNRVKCAGNERQIGQAILLYANEHKGRYPQDLGTLVKSEPIDLDAFICPASGDSVPQNIRTAPKDAQATWVNDNSNFVYIGQGLNFNAPADAVVLYERADNHDQEGMNMLYADGHVEWNEMEVAEKLIKAADAAHKAPTTR
jgi:prepilin-type processing-associated H-X9-DG protein